MSAYAALSEPHRRQILDLLKTGEKSVNDLVAHLGLSQPGVSKHLKVLREAGLVLVRSEGKQRLYGLQPGPLAEVAMWIESYRTIWSEAFDVLEQQLEENHDGSNFGNNR